MKTFIGVKIIEAMPMTLGEYNSYRGWKIPADEDPKKPGFLVKYPDGYESWSPNDVFREAYRLTTGMNFGLALEAMKKGFSVRLPSWKDDVSIKVQYPDAVSKMTAPYLYVESRFGCVPWKETMIELFSDEWQIVN